MLNNLKITNGFLLSEFDPNIYEYEVNVPGNTIFLMLEYETCESCDVTIYGNDFLTEGENHVLIEVYDKQLVTYTLKVNKDISVPVMSYDDMFKLEVEAKDYSRIMGPVIGTSAFLLIVILYCIIFRKKHKIY